MIIQKIWFQLLAATPENQKVDISPLPNTDPGDRALTLWQNGINIVFGLAAAIALLMIVINGFAYITAAGDPQKTAAARQGLLYAIIGLIVVLFSAVIVTFVVRGIL